MRVRKMWKICIAGWCKSFTYYGTNLHAATVF